ncbi:MAG TPA: extracellular solute-binding protein [Burkholderiaceae bacterium]|nr:extracellular solute-binding protein [Burkholderiaceae bacterium]
MTKIDPRRPTGAARRQVLRAVTTAWAFGPFLPPAWAAPAFSSSPASEGERGWTHAIAAYGDPRHPRGFEHFDYADPRAVKGGTLYLTNPDQRTSFDKYNPFTIKGQSPAGVSLFMFETLTVRSGDEPMTVYGLLAESMRLAPDRSSLAFRLHPKARFHNGDPVLAADVKHSFDMLVGPQAAPQYRTALSGVERAVVVDERTVRFDFKERTNDTVMQVAALPVFSRRWGATADGKPKPFDQIVEDEPITSGPYRIALADSGRRIEFERRRDYWAQGLGVVNGLYNFDRIVYRYYADGAVQLEAFKAGEFDLIQEYSARRWARVHAGPKWRDGRIRKEVFETSIGQGFYGYLFNLRRPIFADRRVREAISLAYDFDWINRYKQYLRTYSLFSNSEFAAEGLPSADELALLEPFRAELPPETFGPAYRPPASADDPLAMRHRLRRARDLLAQAGWRLGPDGVLVDAQGRRLEFEYMDAQDGAARTIATWQISLQKLGVRMNLRRVDFALYIKRLETFDFDFVGVRSIDFTLPPALDYLDTFGSKAADQPASGNLRGVRSRAVDALLEAMNRAGTLDQLRAACRALDRVVMHQHWQVPALYAANFRVSYWDRFERPRTMPKYYTPDSALEPLPAWPLVAWWIKPDARR